MEEMTEIVLEGGPSAIPRVMSIGAHKVREGKVKIEWLGGYEHFECADADLPDGSGKPLSFRWTTRTRIAE